MWHALVTADSVIGVLCIIGAVGLIVATWVCEPPFNDDFWDDE